MSKLKENLVKGRNQMAAKEDDVNVVRKEGSVKEKAEKKHTHSFDKMSENEDVIAEEIVKVFDKEEGLVKEKKAEMKDEHVLVDIFVKEEVTIENVLVEGVDRVKYDGSAGRKNLQMEGDETSKELQFKKADTRFFKN